MAKTPRTTPARRKRKAAEASSSTASASASAGATSAAEATSASGTSASSKAERRAEAMRRARLYRERLQAKKGGGSGSGSPPSPKKQKASASPKRKTASPKKKKASASPKKKKASASPKRAGAAARTRTRTTPRRGGGEAEPEEEEESREEEELEEEEEESEEGEPEGEEEEEAAFSSDDERTAGARRQAGARKRRRVAQSPEGSPARAKGAAATGAGEGAGDEPPAERRARRAEEGRRAREWRERRYGGPGGQARGNQGRQSPRSSRSPPAAALPEAPAVAAGGAGSTVAGASSRSRQAQARARARARAAQQQQPQRRRSPVRPDVADADADAELHKDPAVAPVAVEQPEAETELEAEPELETGESRGQGWQGWFGRYPYLGTALLLGLLLGVGGWWSSSSLSPPGFPASGAGPALLRDHHHHQQNELLPRCLVDSPDVPVGAAEAKGAGSSASDADAGGRVGDHPGGDADANADAGGSGIGPWWTRTPPAARRRLPSKSADVRGGCADAANPLPCPRHGRCARGFLVDCRADHGAVSSGNGSGSYDDNDDDNDELFVVSDKSFTECVLSDKARRIVSAVQDKVIGLTVEQKCNVGCRLGVGVPFVSSGKTPGERCGGIDPGDVLAVRSEDGTGDYKESRPTTHHFFSVDGLVGAMRREEGAADAEADAAPDAPPTSVSITSEVVQLLAPHLDGDVIRYIPGSSAVLAPRIGLTIDFMKTKLADHLPFACWFPAAAWQAALFLLGIVVLVFSSILRFGRTHPDYAFYLFLASVVGQHAYLWVERRLIGREAALVVPLVRSELGAHPQGAAVRQLHIRDDIGQTHHLYAGTGARAILRRNWMYKKVWRRVKDEIERDRRFRSEKRRTERGKYMEYWVIEYKGRRATGIGNGEN